MYLKCAIGLITKNKYYRLINDFHRTDNDVHTIMLKYPVIFKAICKYNFHLNNKIIKSLYYNLGYGNWSHLWEIKEEKLYTIEQLCEHLKWDVFYCSDRMSWDRLLRIHWVWQRIKHKLLMSCEEEYDLYIEQSERKYF